MNITLRKVSDTKIWSENLMDFDYSLFIIPQWLEALKDVNKQPVYLDFIRNGDVIAKIAGISIDTGITFNRKLIFYAGPAIIKTTKHDLVNICLGELVKYSRMNRYNHLSILSYDYPHLSDFNCEIMFFHRAEFVVDLSQDKEILRKSIYKERFKDYKKAIKAGFTVAESHAPEMLDHLIKLIEETKKIRISKGYKKYNYYYFPYFQQNNLKNLVKKGVLTFYYVERDSVIHAVQAIIQHDKKAYGLFVGFSEEAYKNGVPSLLQIFSIFTLHERKYEYLNYGGIPNDSSHKGLIHFKKSIGAVEQVSIKGSTNFLLYPYKLLNPLVYIIRNGKNSVMIKHLRKILHC